MTNILPGMQPFPVGRNTRSTKQNQKDYSVIDYTKPMSVLFPRASTESQAVECRTGFSYRAENLLIGASLQESSITRRMIMITVQKLPEE